MRTSWNLLWRAGVITLVYTTASVVVGGLLLQGASTAPATAATPSLLLATTALSGLLLALVLGCTSWWVRASRRRRMWIWSVLVFPNMASVVLEGYFFAPALLPLAMVPRVLALQALTTVVLAAAMAFFFPPSAGAPAEGGRVPRSPLSWTGRFAASAAAYLVFYYFFGAINYALVTGPYYEAHGSLAVPPQPTIMAVEAVRSVLIILSLLPLLAALRASKRKGALLCGFLLFVVGGVVPLLAQVAALPPVLLVASGVEIFFQNFGTGVVAALLLGRPAVPAGSRLTAPLVAAAPGV